VLHSQDYHRLHIACLAMAKQSASPEVKARWLAMAEAWLQRSMELNERRGLMKHEPWAHRRPQRGQQTRL
jgi:hypothetical protein